jgi:hypothetical protein
MVQTGVNNFREGSELQLPNGVTVEFGYGRDERISFIETTDERVRILGRYGVGTTWATIRRDFPYAAVNGSRMVWKYIVQVHRDTWLVFKIDHCIRPEELAISIQLRDDSDAALPAGEADDIVELHPSDPTCWSDDPSPE